MNQQDMPWYDSAEEATKAAIQNSQVGPKAVAGMLYPSLSQNSAYERLMSALNPDRQGKLTFDEHVRIANFVGRYDVLMYCASQCGHELPRQLKTHEMRNQLAGDADDLLRRLDVITRRLQDIDSHDSRGAPRNLRAAG